MIVRILAEHQYEVADGDVAALEALDHKLASAIEANDAGGFSAALSELHEMVRSVGSQLSAETIVPSDLTLPHAGSTLDEVRELLASEEVAGD